MAVAAFSYRRQAAGVRGRVRDAHLDGSLEVAGPQGRKGLRPSAQEQGQEPDADRLAEPFWDGRVDVHRGATDARAFEAYVEHALAPALQAGQVLIMDNLPAHKPKRVRELIEERGCELIYLPAYSPDLNPIEEAFSKIKGMLRRAGARTKEALLEVLGAALSAVSAQDTRGYFEHAGYRPQAQLL